MNRTHENIADVEPTRPNIQRELPELQELLSKRGLKILHQNIRGLLCHKHFVSELLDNFRTIHLLALSETHTTSDDNPHLEIPGYYCEIKHRETGQGGGVSFYVLENIPYQRRHDLEWNDLECIWIEIIFPKTKGFLVGVIYKPPDSSNHLSENFEEKLNEMLETVMAENKECILMGDMNCNYLERSEHKEVKSIISNNGLKQLIKSPTRITNNSKTLIDVIYSNEPEKINSIKVIPADLSDHELLGCVRKLHSIKHSPKQIKCRNYTNYDPKLFCEDLESENFSNVFDSRSTDVAWKHLKEILHYYINKHAPMITKKVKGRLCPWMTTKVKQEMNIRDKLLRRARRTKAENDWSIYKRQRNNVTSLVKKVKNNYFRDLLRENARKPQKFWTILKKAFPTKEVSNHSSAAFNIEGKQTTDIVTIANKFCKYFSSVARKLKCGNNVIKDYVWGKPNVAGIVGTGGVNFKFKYVNEKEIYDELKNLKRKKAQGLDDFPPGLLKDAASLIAKPLTYVINMSLSEGVIPTEWKAAKVTPLYKSGPRTELENYRPISVLPTLSKILERIVHRQLLTYLESNRLLVNYQFGFRRKMSTEFAVTFLTDYIRKKADSGNLTGVLYIDLSKAFDTISHSLLLNKLPSYGITDRELGWFTDYLFLRKQSVEVNGTLSNAYPVYTGVPQGSILGPLLFLLHMNDIGRCLKHSSIITYADDTVLFTSSKCVHDIERRLNEDINSVHRWLNENELILNLKKGKTESMLFGTGKKLSLLGGKQLEIHVDGKLINSTTTYKYLGVHLDPTLTLATHFDKTCKKAASRVNMMRKIRNSLTSNAAEALYRTMVLPIFTYCGTLSLGLPDSRLKRIRRIENRGKNVIASTLAKNMEIRIPSVSSLIKQRACTIVFDCLNNNICELFEKYFEKTEHKYATRNNLNSVKLPKVKIETGRKGFYFLAAKAFNALPPEVRSMKYRTVFRKALEEHCK